MRPLEHFSPFLTISVQLYSVSYGVALMMHVIGRRYEMVRWRYFWQLYSIRGSITHILIGYGIQIMCGASVLVYHIDQ